ncbi:MAG: BON domain-containing protein [Dehalococcoidia bacterium]
MAINDEQIKKEVVDQLYWDQSVDASDVIVEVSDGRVTLKGTVPSLGTRTAAHTDALIIPGVLSVDNQLAVELPPALPAATDNEIKMRAENVLAWSADTHGTNISVSVAAGHVTLNGHVDTYWKKMRAEELVSDLIGVLRVENALSVTPTETLTDKLIAGDIMAALKRRMDLDINLVDVAVDNRVVTLSGTVPNWSALVDVERTARYTAGVVDVVNDLGVRAV